ncbi:hypothetical protein C8N46_1058 [Kordia periserrulae]|uniref:Uncharacterized protein n=1 Tax=Kordia periserrulae TaxID=701523 RepID=A0A2T6BXQ6_9FLAO|nr:hypothetical protein [Kordia periserrulae]PTX60854.1 hypothetical protein C8N46_1058 [Kordia periserrulae]
MKKKNLKHLVFTKKTVANVSAINGGANDRTEELPIRTTTIIPTATRKPFSAKYSNCESACFECR